MEQGKLADETNFLLNMVGTWNWTMPGEDGSVADQGSETVTALKDCWIVIRGESNGETNLFQFGYDPAKKKIVGTFISSTLPHLWVYEGTLEGTAMTTHSVGPRFDGKPGLSKYRDTFNQIDLDHRTLTSEILEEDGTWSSFMFAEYKRTPFTTSD